MNDLYYPPKPKSKLEEYNEKLKERELYTNNILDRFIENGSGAPKHDKNGNLITKRRKFLDDSEDFRNQQIIQSPLIQQNNNMINNNISAKTSNTSTPLHQSFNKSNNNINRNKNMNSLNAQTNRRYNNNALNNNGLINTLDQHQLKQINQNNININSSTPYNIKENNTSKNEIDNNNEENMNIKNKTKNYEENNIFDKNYNGLGILPRNSDDDKTKRFLRQEALKAELKKEIEERKIKKEREKQLQRELDLREDLKVLKAIEEEKQLLKLEKKRKEEYEAQISKANMLNSQNNKPKKKLIDIDEYYNKDINFKKISMQIQNNNNKNIEVNNINETTENNKNNEEEIKNNNEQNKEINNNLINTINIRANKNNNNASNTYNFKINAFHNMRKIRQDIVKDINNFNINVNMEKKEDNNNIDAEIDKLRNEVRSQYLEMNDIFKQLKMDEDDAQQYKNKKDRESKVIRQELFKNQMAYALSKNMLERNYEDNMNVNYDELINKNINSIDSNTDLQGTSNFLYFDKESSNKENNNNTNGGMSSLAMAGKNVIELKGENELIPINNGVDNEDDNEMDINKLDLKNEERKNEDENDKKGIMQFKQEMERERLLYDDNDKKCTMDDLYKELNAIESINQTLSPINKIQTLKNNFDVDYGEYSNKEKQKLKYKFLK